ncbi:MAG TPA: transglutaminase family protein, partial [Candidatus Angelobacter sp.]|nr:transglutaminase family protein [Candidatus Angelobacter sp.]
MEVRSKVIHIPDGDAGIARTIQFMRLAALQGARSPQIRGLALHIVRDVPSRDSQGEVQAIYNWVKQNIKFRGEYEETIQTPEVTLRFRAGDCDDHSVLLSALLASIGYRTEFKTVAVRGERQYSHV